MITIRPVTDLSEPTLIGLEATLTMQGRTFIFSSNGPIVEATSPRRGDNFGALSWPRSRFELGGGIFLEQQMFLSHDGSVAALSWELRGGPISAELIIRPYFSGCDPRTYRDVGFRYESQEQDGRLAWLPTVRGPRIIADTNGRYSDEPSGLRENSALAFVRSENLVAPGSFEFELSAHPSVIIFSTEDSSKIQRDQSVGAFLAGLMQKKRSYKSDYVTRHAATVPADFLVAAA